MQIVMERTSFSLTEEELEEINSNLEYGDNRSAWIRDAVKLKFAVLEEVGNLENDMSNEERREFVVEAISGAVEDG